MVGTEPISRCLPEKQELYTQYHLDLTTCPAWPGISGICPSISWHFFAIEHLTWFVVTHRLPLKPWFALIFYDFLNASSFWLGWSRKCGQLGQLRACFPLRLAQCTPKPKTTRRCCANRAVWVKILNFPNRWLNTRHGQTMTDCWWFHWCSRFWSILKWWCYCH